MLFLARLIRSGTVAKHPPANLLVTHCVTVCQECEHPDEFEERYMAALMEGCDLSEEDVEKPEVEALCAQAAKFYAAMKEAGSWQDQLSTFMDAVVDESDAASAQAKWGEGDGGDVGGDDDIPVREAT